MQNKKGQLTLQLGKNGLAEGFFELLENSFRERGSVRLHLLKSAGHDRERTKQLAEQIVERLGKKYTYKIIGFTIILKKWRKEKQRQKIYNK